MGKAVRAIIIENKQLLVMHRNKKGSQYYTLVGGQVADGESLEAALVREIREETGLTVTDARMVFVEKHPSPYNEQYIYLAQVAPHAGLAIQEYSEEAALNREGINLHQPVWINSGAFATMPFRTPLLHQAIMKALKKGFPNEPVALEDQPRGNLLRRIFGK